jgi:DNA-binding IclR family transcriptional regulator
MTGSKYRTPALEKGLDILELLAREKRPLLTTQMANLLDRSMGEIFRMVMTLLDRGYIENSEGGDAYILSSKLFLLGMASGSSQNLVASAIPIMQALCKKTGEACHLVITANDQIVVIARVEAPGDTGYTVRVGHVRPIALSNSGIVLYAFQPDGIREQWRDRLIKTVSAGEWRAFEANADMAREQGRMVRQSAIVKAVTDISCPIFSDLGIAAALTMPYLESHVSADLQTCVDEVRIAAEALSRELGG